MRTTKAFMLLVFGTEKKIALIAWYRKETCFDCLV